MTNCFSSRFAALACVALLSAAAATPAEAQVRIDRDQTGRVVAITGLPASSGCVRGTGTGRVVDRVVEKGELQGFTFNEPPYDDSYINLPAAYDIRDRAAYARLQAAFDDLFRKGARLKVRSVACGAAGRIVKLVSATLIDAPPAPRVAAVPAPAPTPPTSAPAAPAAPSAAPPPAPAAAEPMDALLRSPDSPAKPAVVPKAEEPPASVASQPQPAAAPPAAPRKPSRWRLYLSSKTEIQLAIRSNEGAFGFAIHCKRSGSGISFSHWFVSPDRWPMGQSATPASIDGRLQRWDLDGAFEGVFFSDNLNGSSAGLAESSLAEIARGERFVVFGATSRAKPRHAVFHTAGGEEAFADFAARCRALRG